MIDRRRVLQGIAVTGVAGLVSPRMSAGIADAAAAPRGDDREPLWAVVNGDETGDEFLRGVAEVGSPRLEVRRIGRRLEELLPLRSEFDATGACRVVGLLDDASGTIVVDLARSAGARLQWLGQHTVDPGTTRHRLLGAGDADASLDWLDRRLRAGGTDYAVVVERHGDRPLRRQGSGSAPAGEAGGEWASAIGCLMAARGRLPTGPAPARPPCRGPAGRFVSFAMSF